MLALVKVNPALVDVIVSILVDIASTEFDRHGASIFRDKLMNLVSPNANIFDTFIDNGSTGRQILPIMTRLLLGPPS